MRAGICSVPPLESNRGADVARSRNPRGHFGDSGPAVCQELSPAEGKHDISRAQRAEVWLDMTLAFACKVGVMQNAFNQLLPPPNAALGVYPDHGQSASALAPGVSAYARELFGRASHHGTRRHADRRFGP